MRSEEKIPSPPKAALSPLGKGRNGVQKEILRVAQNDREIVLNDRVGAQNDKEELKISEILF